MNRTDALLASLEANREAALARLRAWLAIPSVSTDPAHAAEVRRSAEWIAGACRALDLETAIHPTEGHPLVVARTPEAEHDPERPTVLFYGHHDVQPPDPLERWSSPPFEPTLAGGAIRARGASDDKGQVACFLEALRAWRATGDGSLPVNLKILVEGEEEIGSPHLAPYLEAHREALAADVVLVSDTTMWDARTLAITCGLRGLLYYELELAGPARDLHSGMYGGVAVNPAVELTRVLGALFDASRRITLPGFYDDVRPVSDAERRAWEALGFDPLKDCLEPVGLTREHGEAGFSTLERKWARPSLDVNGLDGGYTGEGAKTVIPATCRAKLSFRLAPDQRAERIAEAFEAWLAAFDVGECRWTLTRHGSADPVSLPTDSPWMAAAQRACESASGRPPVLVREGATIPVIADFQRILGLPSLLIGFGLPEDAIHSPDEQLGLDRFELGCRTHALLLGALGRARDAP